MLDVSLTFEETLERRAKEFAIAVHGGQRYGEHPYRYHIKQVVDNVKLRKAGDSMLSTYVAVAWLHDTMEDCNVSYETLIKEFGMAIAYAVKAMTKIGDYDKYIQNCIDCVVAREVKICDTMANLTQSFESSGSPNPAERAKGEKGMKKYPKQLDMLMKGEVE